MRKDGTIILQVLYRKNRLYSEKDAAIVVRQMLNVAARCHLNGVVHRDLKPEVINFAVCWDCSLLMMGLNVLAIIVIVVCL
jgi:calcium-dependent protein kinase